MKHFLIFLFAVCSFFAAPAQDVVVIPPDVADYFLAQDDRAKLQDSLIVVKDEKIGALQQLIGAQAVTIQTHQTDSVAFAAIIAVKDDRLKLKEEDYQFAIRELRKHRRQKYVIAGAGAGAVAGSFFGPMGAAAGAVIGGASGFVTGLIKRRI